MNTSSSAMPTDPNASLPGHGLTTRESDPTGGRSDPRGSGTTGHDRDTLGADASALSDAASDSSRRPASRQSEFSAFLDDLKQLVRGQPAPQSNLRGQIQQRVGQAKDRMSSAFGSAQDAGAAVGDRMRSGLDQSRDLVNDRPLQAVTAAALVGLLVGYLMAGRR